MDLVDLLRLFYLSLAVLVKRRTSKPTRQRHRLMIREHGKAKTVAAKDQIPKTSPNVITDLLDSLAQWTVPHDYFWTFYFVAVVLSLFWPGEALLLKGPLFRAVAGNISHDRAASTTFEQVKITCIMMFIQGARRMYECLTLSNEPMFQDETKQYSQMWAGHWIMGLLFYVATSIAVWVEGVSSIESHDLSTQDLLFKAPSFRTLLAVTLFVLASGFQNDCHHYLAYLKASKNTNNSTRSKDENSDGYKLPDHAAFNLLISPHYFAECLVYLALAIEAAPPGAWLNWTLANALTFVVVNLGVTAEGTREWYRKRFGEEAVRDKWRMIPFIY